MAGHTGRKVLLIVCVVIAVIIFIAGISGIFTGSGSRIGVVEVEGTITDLKDVMADIVRFREDDSIRGVIVRINSPGGAVGPTQEAASELKKLKAKKKVYVSMGSVCASGGYYIAAVGEKLYANPSTITGSIGVIMQQTVVEDLMKKIGVQANTIKAGAMKDVGNPFRKMTDYERKYLQDIIDGIHEQFIKDVAAGRKMNIDKARGLADGRIYTGLQAKEAGLIDNIGTFYDAVDAMKTTLGIKGKPELVYGKKPFSPLKWLVSSALQDIFTREPVAPFRYEYRP
ncbi:MAG: signal peptide peptidase SppA [Syntrophorhabdaceae bacterium]|nr:signal peptide peptidase SppA [Syntrophorhabdaceae bacterium]MDD4196372.1 signal peptide peptidase SppA [Syntrophorhabdaceae bacterium]